MRKRISLVVLAFLLALASTYATGPATHVYIAGEVGSSSTSTLPVYWEDGVMSALPLSATYTNGWTSGVTEDSSGNLYFLGGQHKEGSTIYGYWKNSTFTQFTPPKEKTFWEKAIAVDASGKVWVVGVAKRLTLRAVGGRPTTG
jgi:hypothetical protein